VARSIVQALVFIVVFLPQVCFSLDWCGTSRITPGEVKTNYMIVNSRVRAYGLYVPQNLRPDSPLIIDFHGFGANRVAQEQSSCWGELAEREGAIVVYPQGGGVVPSWDAGDYCCDTGGGNDIDFSLQLVECLTNTNSRNKGLFVDQDRVYAAGLSNGGAMAGLLACEHSEVFSGAVITSQSFPLQHPEQCRSVHANGTRKPAVPIIETRGTVDVIVPYGFSWGWSVPAGESLQRWGYSMGCSGEPIVEDVCDRPGSGPDCEYGKTQCKTYYDCDGGAVASQCTLIDGHLLYKNPHDFNICEDAWVEFERHGLIRQ